MRKENPELKKPPVGSGCEWILSQTKDEYKTSMETAKRLPRINAINFNKSYYLKPANAGFFILNNIWIA